jgi:hypothetical protein
LTRISLPNRRAGETFEVRLGQLSFWITVGFLQDGSPIEVFAGMKGGRNSSLSSDVEAIARDAGVLISIARQYGAAMQTLREAVTRDESGRPASILGAILDAMAEKREV